jgi:HSP20 family protein
MAFFYVSAAEARVERVLRPPLDVYRTGTGWLLKFDLPGVRAEDVDIQTYGSTLVVRGARRDHMDENVTSVHSMEISYTRFERAIDLPCNLEEARLTLEFRDGNLMIRVSSLGGNK